MAMFLYGVCTVSFLATALFFWRFWRRTQDRLFIYFSAAFCLLGIERIAIARFHPMGEEHAAIFLLRSIAFCLIIAAIIDKNRKTLPK